MNTANNPSLYKVEVESKLSGNQSSWEQSDRLYVLSLSQEDARRTVLGRINPQQTKITQIGFHREVRFVSDAVIDMIMQANKIKYIEEIEKRKVDKQEKNKRWKASILNNI